MNALTPPWGAATPRQQQQQLRLACARAAPQTVPTQLCRAPPPRGAHRAWCGRNDARTLNSCRPGGRPTTPLQTSCSCQASWTRLWSCQLPRAACWPTRATVQPQGTLWCTMTPTSTSPKAQSVGGRTTDAVSVCVALLRGLRSVESVVNVCRGCSSAPPMQSSARSKKARARE